MILAGIDPCFSCNDRAVTIRRRGRRATLTWEELRRYGIALTREERNDRRARRRRSAALPGRAVPARRRPGLRVGRPQAGRPVPEPNRPALVPAPGGLRQAAGQGGDRPGGREPRPVHLAAGRGAGGRAHRGALRAHGRLRPVLELPRRLVVTLYLLSMMTLCIGLAGANTTDRFSLVGRRAR